MRWNFGNAALRHSALLGSIVLWRTTTPSPHSDLFPLDARDIVGFILAILSLLIAAGGGIGGGALLVPICLIVLDFQPNNAVALSNVTIVGGALANFLFNAHRRHPYGDKPLIDWDLIMMMEPTTILGALLGSYINKVMPAWLTTTLLATLLTLLSYKLVTRGIATYRQESRDIAAATAAQEEAARAALEWNEEAPELPSASVRPLRFRRMQSFISASEVDHHVDHSDDHSGTSGAAQNQHNGTFSAISTDPAQEPLLNGHPSSDAEDPPSQLGVGESAALDSERMEQQYRLAKVERSESRQLPLERIATLFLLTAAVIVTDSLKAKVRCASASYWVISLSLVPLTMTVSWSTAVVLVRNYKAKVAAGRSLHAGEVAWTPKHVVVYPLICSLAGLVAGMFGVGGGIIKGPLMLEMGVLPDVAAGTSATMIMFTAASASAVYIGFGTVKYDYGIALFVIGLVATFVGQAGATHVMRRLQRRSVIVGCMASLMLLSTVVMYGEAAARIRAAVLDHAIWQFGDICS